MERLLADAIKLQVFNRGEAINVTGRGHFA